MNSEPRTLRCGAHHLLLRYVRGTISLRQLHVDGERKSIAVHDVAQLPVRAEGLEPLPDDARLVAAREIESDDLGICLPILVFHASARDSGSLAQSMSAPRQTPTKRRRPSDASPSSFYFFVLTGAAVGTDVPCVLQFINRVDLPIAATRSVAIGSESSNESASESALQVHLVDGPYVVVHDASAAQLAILRLDAADARFAVWRASVQLPDAVADTAMALQSCTRVASDASAEPHLLLHFGSAQNESASVFNGALESHWLVYRLSSPAAALESCAYVTVAPLDAGAGSTDSSDEQVTCCALLAHSDDALGLPSAVDMVAAATVLPSQQRQQVGVSPSTLVVTGTTRNTLYVHDCGVLLLSCVLPTTPSDIVQVDGANSAFVLAVRCNDVNSSFFLLSFSASAFQPSMTIIHAFSHVGRVLVGDFTAQSSTAEVLLLNDIADTSAAVAVVAHSSGISEDPPPAVATTARDIALVSKCVVICKKHAADKHSIHRLRAEDPALRDRARGAKRSRDSRAKDKSVAPPRYIERIKLGVPKQQPACTRSDGSGAAVDDVGTRTASQRHLTQLANSLATRLQSGVCELDRLRLVVADKRDMVTRLNQFVIDTWWRAQQGGGASAASLRLPFRVVFATEPRATPYIEVVRLVTAAQHAEPVDAPPALTPAYELQPLVALHGFRVLDFAPATATLRVQVALRNTSTRSLRDAFVSLAGSSSIEDGSSPLRLESTSSVLTEFPAERALGDSVASFVLDATLPPTFALLRARKPVCVTVWLHCHTDEPQAAAADSQRQESRTQARSSIECSLVVGAVAIQPHEFVNSPSGTGRLDQRETLVARETEKLLVLSSGSNLARVFQVAHGSTSAQRHLIDNLLARDVLRPDLVRPTFALMTLAIAERAEAKYHMSDLLAGLPDDVYTMLNPLQAVHVRSITALLQAIRAEMVVMQQHSVHVQSGVEVHAPAVARDAIETSEDSMSVDSDASTTRQQWQLLTAFRRRQSKTDTRAAALLHAMQQRANYHSMWHAAAP